MKKIFFVPLAAVVMLTAYSCNKNNPDPVNNNYMRCKLNGTLWESRTADVGALYVSSAGLVTFSGDDGTMMVTANLAGINDTGHFAMGVGTGSAMSFVTVSSAHYINVDFGTGTFYLQEIKGSGTSHNFSGKFEGVASNASNDTIWVTDGEIESF